MKEARPTAWAHVLGLASLLLLVGPCLAYGGVYAYARSTHRLVHYAGGFIARPNAMHGLGFSWWEVVFAPAAWVEEDVRDVVDPAW